MNKQFNLDDNIFILNVKLRMLQDLLSLDPDPGLFLKKTLEDMDFIDNALSTMMKYLTDRTKLLDREEGLEKLADMEWRFEQILTGIRGDSDIISALNLDENKEKLQIYKNNCIQRRKIIESSRSGENESETEPLVTHNELNQLLSDL